MWAVAWLLVYILSNLFSRRLNLVRIKGSFCVGEGGRDSLVGGRLSTTPCPRTTAAVP